MNTASQELATLSRIFYHAYPVAATANEIMVKPKHIKFFNFTMLRLKDSNISLSQRDAIVSYAIANPQFARDACAMCFLCDVGERCSIPVPALSQLDDAKSAIKNEVLAMYGEADRDLEIVKVPLSPKFTLDVSRRVVKLAALYQSLYNYLVSPYGCGDNSLATMYAEKSQEMLEQLEIFTGHSVRFSNPSHADELNYEKSQFKEAKHVKCLWVNSKVYTELNFLGDRLVPVFIPEDLVREFAELYIHDEHQDFITVLIHDQINEGLISKKTIDVLRNAANDGLTYEEVKAFVNMM